MHQNYKIGFTKLKDKQKLQIQKTKSTGLLCPINQFSVKLQVSLNLRRRSHKTGKNID